MWLKKLTEKLGYFAAAAFVGTNLNIVMSNPAAAQKAAAQDDASTESDDVDIEEIVVTSERRETSYKRRV